MSLNNNKARQEKMHSYVRQIMVEQIDKDKAQKSLIDPKLVKGGNALYVVQDPALLTWTFRYKSGILPQMLKEQKFTRFDDALRYATSYLNSKGFNVTGTEDVWTLE